MLDEGKEGPLPDAITWDATSSALEAGCQSDGRYPDGRSPFAVIGHLPLAQGVINLPEINVAGWKITIFF